MRRLAASDLLPERAGQPVKAWAHMSLADLLRLDGSSALQEEWTAQVRAQWAAHRAEASQGGGDGGAWLDGDAAEGIACDAAMAPVVTGDVNVAVLEDLVRLCTELSQLRHADADDRAAAAAGGEPGPPGVPGPDAGPAREALERAIIGAAVDLLSGPATPAASTPVGRGRSWPARVPMAPFAVLAVVVALALLSAHPHIAWVPVLALVAVRLLAGGRRCRRWDGRAPR